MAKKEEDLTIDSRKLNVLFMEEADWMLLDKGWKPKA